MDRATSPDAANGGSEAIRSQLECNICSELLVDPVTAARCGHTFCRLCLKKWIAAQRRSLRRCCPCPMCRKPMGLGPDGGMPAVSITLRNLVRQMFPEEAQEREQMAKVLRCSFFIQVISSIWIRPSSFIRPRLLLPLLLWMIPRDFSRLSDVLLLYLRFTHD